jgi:hypothetical protein
MPQDTLLDELDSIVEATAQASRRKTWFDHLPSDAREVLTAARKKFHAGGYEISRHALAKVLIEHAKGRGWRTCDQRRMCEWLLQS